MHDFKVGDNVIVIKDATGTDLLLNKTGKIVHFYNEESIGVDFGMEIGSWTWRLDRDLLPGNTGRYLPAEYLKKYNKYEVELT